MQAFVFSDKVMPSSTLISSCQEASYVQRKNQFQRESSIVVGSAVECRIKSFLWTELWLFMSSPLKASPSTKPKLRRRFAKIIGGSGTSRGGEAGISCLNRVGCDESGFRSEHVAVVCAG